MAADVVPVDGWWGLDAWVLDPLTLALVLAAGTAYAAGIRSGARRGRPTGAAARLAFWTGLATVMLALLSPIDAYAEFSFTVHMLQHLLLTLVAAPLLVVGEPVGVALRGLAARPARRLAAVLRSRPVRWMSSPVVGWLCFVGVPVAVHLSGFFDLALRSAGWHAAEHALWVGAALIYWWPIVGADPNPHPVGYPARILSLLLAMPAMSFLALAIYASSTPLAPTYAALPPPWGPAALDDQADAAVVMWVGGNLILVGAMLLVAASWKRHEDESQRKLEAREDAAQAAPPGQATPRDVDTVG
jgi:putative membrane protein